MVNSKESPKPPIARASKRRSKSTHPGGFFGLHVDFHVVIALALGWSCARRRHLLCPLERPCFDDGEYAAPNLVALRFGPPLKEKIDATLASRYSIRGKNKLDRRAFNQASHQNICLSDFERPECLATCKYLRSSMRVSYCLNLGMLSFSVIQTEEDDKEPG